ncbi:hypothetical protein V5799_021638 [Amblyomma americanum]|uniref:Small ribosomal subunit protein mS35 mitochondrial conserved domain-containing protein n=1 Tax=Amblyomma americanum TaxID=6943 RepID=A0AAQ4FPA4_AMBAM
MLRDVHYCLRKLPSASNTVLSRKMCFVSAGDKPDTASLDEDRKFRKLDLYKPKEERKPKREEIKFDRTLNSAHGSGRLFREQVPQPRSERMPVDQDWPSVWPTAQSFRPSVVPLPLRQGYSPKGAPPGKYANLELMKVPNFLHLTPVHLAKHAKVLRPFCTPWPAGLETDEKCEKHFPVEVIDSDYCHASPSIRDARSRIVTLRVKLSDLELDYHARDKLLRLAGDRYDPATDVLTIVTDRCPLKRQNYEYAHYLLTAVYHESWKTEPWEADKAESDMECFFWEKSRSEANAVQFVRRLQQSLAGQDETTLPHVQGLSPECTDDDVKAVAEVKDYGEAVCEIHNGGESEQAWEKYKRSVCSLLGLKHAELSPEAGEVQVS